MKRVLILEDDDDLREGLAFSLGLEGYEIRTAGTIREGLSVLEQENCAAVLLDCNLPDGSGFDLCRRIREEYGTPVLMLTARDTEMDEVKALELGVDDFMSKPFSLAVLKARLKRLLAREEQETRLVSCGIVVDKRNCKVSKNDEEIPCSRMEYQLLVYLMENKNQVVSREQILEHVWDSRGRFVDENTVSVNIRRLRAKLEEDPGEPQRIRTVHGLGYIWKEQKE